ncbi:MAG: MFS transporter [Oscillospiraceae bacterium]|nr:MFS transporter [Oscillospiraceae bacterium]
MEQTGVKKLAHGGRSQFLYFLTKFSFSILTCTELYYFAAFLTDTAMFSLAIIGLIQTATTVIDAIFSFFYGALMEKIGALMPWGSTRSWLLVGPPIATILFIFCFVRISDNEMVSAVVIIIAFILSHVVWSIGECSMNALSVLMTDDVSERASMSINLGRGTMGSSLVFGFIAGFFLNTLFVGSPLAYVYMIIIFGVFYWVCWILMFIESKGCEPTKEEKAAKAERAAKVAALSSRSATLGQAYKYVFSSKNTICVMLAILFGYCWTFLGSGLMFYFFNISLDSAALMGTFMSIRGLISLLGGVFFVPLLLKLCKGSKRMCYIVSNILSAVPMLINFFWRPANVWITLIIMLIGSFLGSGATMMQVGLMGDCGTQLTYKNNKDVAAFTVSFMALPLKLALILRSVLITAAIGMTGYVAGMAPTESVVNGFYTAYLIWPVVLIVISTIPMLIYNLPESKVTEMIKENDRRAAEDNKMVEEALAKMEAQG